MARSSKKHATKMKSRQSGSKSSMPIGKLFKLAFFVVGIVATAIIFVGVSAKVPQQHQQQQETPEMIGKRLANDFKKRPRDANARFLLSWFAITAQGGMDAKIGGTKNMSAMELLVSCFDVKQVDQLLGESEPLKGFLAASLIGRYMQEKREGEMSLKYLTIAYNISKEMSPQRDIGEVCTHLQLATQLDSYPLSNDHVDASVARMEEWANKLIDLYTVEQHKDVHLNQEWMSQNMPGFGPDPYWHCMLPLFPLSFYYRADVAKIANLNYQLGALAFPKLLYTAKHVLEYDAEQQVAIQASLTLPDEASAMKDNDAEEKKPAPVQKCIGDKKIKLGVISSTFSRGHSVAEDFGGILQRLDRSKFDVTYAYTHERSTPGDEAGFLSANGDADKLVHYYKKQDEVNDAAWIRRIGKEIEEFQFDMILYLDMTMSSYTRRLGMERLAPVQINTHGHPVTSGHPRETIQHFVSWAEAELPLEESQTHYTEELQLIPKGKIHQYYTPRLLEGDNGKCISRMSGMPFDQLTRKDFPELPAIIQNSGNPDDDDIHLYVSMQKPQKVFPDFDELLCGVLQKDPKGHAILHKDDVTGHTGRFQQRMKAAGCDMDRVHFISSQMPHQLMYLYKTANVILDSYPAGGCTTTREALELGKAVVTWPARLLGGRWTLGLYNTIGLDSETRDLVIANSKEEYIAKAVELGTNQSLRKTVEEQILKVIPNLFGRKEAVEEWEKILLRVSPVKQCAAPEDEPTGNDEL
mmetsp:Transcript_6920/g.12122  ORF Transcript_6920/g.12122 Transcript_6920/m.12122 type:complete len:752 (+) Transcript_6920:127-2382(+)